MGVDSTFTLQSVLDTINPFIYNLPLSITEDGQPFLGICNMVAQFMTAPPLEWRWNRATIHFLTIAGTQDYAYSPIWSAGLSVSSESRIIDSNGNGEYALTSGITGSGSAPVWPTFPTGLYTTTIDNTVTWQMTGPLGQMPEPLNDLGNPTNCALYDITKNPIGTVKGFVQIENKMTLQKDSTLARPRFFSTEYDNLNGSVLIRFMPVPDQAYPVTITYQRAFVPFTALTSSWSIPDDMYYIYAQGVLAMCYQYANDSRYALANSKFVSGILGYQDGLTDFEKNIFLNNWDNLTNSEVMKGQQGIQSRGI